MPFYKFKTEDLYYNRIKTFPQQTFAIFDSKVYINGFKHSGRTHEGGTSVSEIGAPQGFISLYELNIDRVISTDGEPPGDGSIYPFITKEGARTAFKTVSTSVFDSTSQFAYGDVIKSKYPLTASIKRIRFGASSAAVVDVSEDNGMFRKASGNKKYILALKNSFDKYTNISKHYAFNSASTSATINWDKGLQEMSLIEIPSIFYGSSIKKGSVSLRFYITGALAAELKDIKRNGELIQVSGTSPATSYDSKVGGVVLYNEGFMALTGAWSLNNNFTDKYVGGDYSNPKWLNFGAGTNDGIAAGTITGSAFEISYEGINYVPTITMLAHAPRGRLNNSMNPTFIEKGQDMVATTSSLIYNENNELKIKNLAYTPYLDPTGSFVKQVYISKIGIYDKDKNLIGIAKLANPVRKTEERGYTFKLKYDF